MTFRYRCFKCDIVVDFPDQQVIAMCPMCCAELDLWYWTPT